MNIFQDCQCPAFWKDRTVGFILCGKEMINKQHCPPDAQYRCTSGKKHYLTNCNLLNQATSCAPFTKEEIEKRKTPDSKEDAKYNRKCTYPENYKPPEYWTCLLYTSDAADDLTR